MFGFLKAKFYNPKIEPDLDFHIQFGFQSRLKHALIDDNHISGGISGRIVIGLFGKIVPMTTGRLSHASIKSDDSFYQYAHFDKWACA